MQIKIAYAETKERSFVVEWDTFRRQNMNAWRHWKESNFDEDEEVTSEEILDFIYNLMDENGESIINDNQFQTNDDWSCSFDLIDVREY